MSHRVRQADVDDIAALVRLRRVMFEAMGNNDSDALDAMCQASERYFSERIPAERFFAWLAEDGGQAVASIGLVVHSIPPSPDRLDDREAYIMSLVTLPSYRRRGIAAELLECALVFAREQGIGVASLHATSAGRGVYARAGFSERCEIPEMSVRLFRESGSA